MGNETNCSPVAFRECDFRYSSCLNIVAKEEEGQSQAASTHDENEKGNRSPCEPNMTKYCQAHPSKIRDQRGKFELKFSKSGTFID